MSDPHSDEHEAERAEESARPGPSSVAGLNGGLAKAIRAGSAGEDLSASGVLDAIGGIRGVLETIVPSLVFLVLFIFTQDARISAIIPGVLAVLLVVVRLVRRETVVSALSGMFGVGLAVLITLITGRGVDYFLWGFIVNIAWGAALLISILVRWPAIGLIIGGLRGDLKSWRADLHIRRVATLLTVMWFAMFVARLAVQLPMYLAENVEALGVARIVMGVPLFACVIIATWFGIRRVSHSSDDVGPENDVISKENTPSE